MDLELWLGLVAANWPTSETFRGMRREDMKRAAKTGPSRDLDRILCAHVGFSLGAYDFDRLVTDTESTRVSSKEVISSSAQTASPS